VDGGYTQKDIIEVARAFTGWTIAPEQAARQQARLPRGAVQEGDFRFAPMLHDTGEKVVLDGDQETPLPWSNVLANPEFGTIVSASGSAFTWADNSRENRLTPFDNDPTEALIDQTKYELKKLIKHIDDKKMPFDGTFEKYLDWYAKV
jgi:hypothetical protein